MPNQQRTIYLLSRLNHAIHHRVDEMLREYGITAVQFTVLSLLRLREQLSSAEIARRFSVTPQSMNEVIFALEGKHLIARSEDPGNRRVLRVVLTAAGHRMLEGCDARIDDLEARLFVRLNLGQLAQLRNTTSELLTFLRSAGDAAANEQAQVPLRESKPDRLKAARTAAPRWTRKRAVARSVGRK
jgi:DNA-binding MarR family transcriptional regulator